MNRKTLLAAAALAVIVLAAGLALLREPEQPEQAVVRVTLDGKVVEELPLEGTEKTFTLTGESGLSNTVVVENGTVRVDHADCPDQICVDQGAISNGTVPIVCLPNKLIIEVVGGGEDLDSAAG